MNTTTPSSGPNPMHAAAPVTSCLQDPDCGAAGTCSQYQCPDYWSCEALATGGKRCTNPGPDYPGPEAADSSAMWRCEDSAGRTICRGSQVPSDGGGVGWTCVQNADVVECSSTARTPDVPHEGSWLCRFNGTIRVCESGPAGGGWLCVPMATGGVECRLPTPEYPDDRDWSCLDAMGTTVCSGTGTPPASTGEWTCTVMGELVSCTDQTPRYPGQSDLPPPATPTGDAGIPGPPPGTSGEWNCFFGDEVRICRQGMLQGGDTTPPHMPGGGGGACVQNSERWCDDFIYCSWGKQRCLPGGQWGPCVEPTFTFTGLSDRPNNQCACDNFYFNYECCEDQQDRDRDGFPDCLIPAGHTAPVCPPDWL